MYGFTEDAARRVVDGVRKIEKLTPPKQHRQHKLRDDGIQWEPFRNDSNETIPAYAVMREIGTYAPSPYVRRVRRMGKPNTTFQREYWVNGPTPVPARNSVTGDGCGFCTRLSIAGPVLYDTATVPTFGQEWGPKIDEWKLFPNRPGFIVDEPDDSLPSGVITARQEAVNYVLGKLDANTGTRTTETPGTGQLSIYFRDGNAAGTVLADSTWNVQITTISSKTSFIGKYVGAIWYCGKWLLINEDC